MKLLYVLTRPTGNTFQPNKNLQITVPVVSDPTKFPPNGSNVHPSSKNRPKTKRPQTTCTAIVFDQKSILFDTQRFSTWSNQLKVAANVFRFIRRLRSPTSPSTLISEDFRNANHALIKQSEFLSFASTFHQLRRNLKQIYRDKLIPFRPFIDQSSLLSSHGRLVYAPLAQAIRTPLLLDSKEPITKLYLKHAHEICCHAGSEFVKAFVRQRFKVLGIRAALRSINYSCFICRRFRAENNVQQEMAPLPQLRFSAKQARNHRSRSKKLELTSSVPSSLSTAVRLRSITALISTVSSPAPATSNPALA